MQEDIHRIKVVLVDKKRTNKWLSEQVGRDSATVSKWFTNKSQPALDALSEIADLLGFEITDLLRSSKKIVDNMVEKELNVLD